MSVKKIDKELALRNIAQPTSPSTVANDWLRNKCDPSRESNIPAWTTPLISPQTTKGHRIQLVS